MGKRQHQKDKMYLTATEWAWLHGGRRPDQRSLDELRARIARLPYNHCCLSLTLVTMPVCNQAGYIFDKSNVIRFIKKFKCDPITGETPFTEKNLIDLKFHKNSDDEFHCPILSKRFNENSKIAAIKTTGNVYSYEAIEELNLKSKNFRDLLTDQPFTRKDIIILQDMMQTDRIPPGEFYHFKRNLKWIDEEEEESKVQGESHSRINKMDHVTRSTLKELEAAFPKSTHASSSASSTATASTAASSSSSSSSSSSINSGDTFNTATYSTGKVSASATSTVMTTHTKVEAAVVSDDVYKYSKVKKKGYVTIETSLGPLNLELFCQWAPKTCENFLKLSHSNYYNDTIFHRSIKNFMIQGGDPTGTGTGGNSIWGEPFADEFSQHLSHDGRGVLSMANSGANTNKSQFFITFRSCKHLDKKHTIFGKLVGGFETLDKMEKVETDAKDCPKDEIRIKKMVVYVDPFKEIDEFMEEERKKDKSSRCSDEQMSAPVATTRKQFRSGVGSFIDLEKVSSIHSLDATDADVNSEPVNDNNNSSSSSKKMKNKAHAGKFGDFSSW